MKRIFLGAAGLLLGTSALAGVSMVKADGAKTMPAASPLQPKAASGLDDAMIHNAMLIDWPTKNATSVETASLDVKAMDEPKLIQAEPAKPASSESADTAPDDVAAKPADSEPMPTDSAETPPTPGDPAVKPNEGMGGPLESADGSTAVLDLSPRPAAQNYPPCAPGPGDDRCIQLYEPGVRVALASWSGPTGGLDNGQTGMGGPEEEIDQTSAIDSGQEEASYEPLPEDAVMPADEDVALTTSPKSDTLAL